MDKYDWLAAAILLAAIGVPLWTMAVVEVLRYAS
jgi:hypothetical protein